MVAAVLLSADIHFALYVDGYSSIPLIGLLNAVSGILIGLVVLIWWHWIVVLGAIGFGTATLAAFLLSRTVGLLGFYLPAWGPQAVLAWTADAVALTSGVVPLLRQRS